MGERQEILGQRPSAGRSRGLHPGWGCSVSSLRRGLLRNLKEPPAQRPLLLLASCSQLFGSPFSWFLWGGGNPLFDPGMPGEPEWGHSTPFCPLLSLYRLCVSLLRGGLNSAGIVLSSRPLSSLTVIRHTRATPVPCLSSWFTFPGQAGPGHSGRPLRGICFINRCR